MKKSLWFIIGFIGIIVLTAGVYLGVDAYNMSGNATTYVSLAVNPEVEFTVNANNRVVSVISLDTEADEIVQNINFVGMTTEYACEMFTQACVLAGYIDVDGDEETTENNEIVVTVVNESAQIRETLQNNIRSRIQRYFYNQGIFGRVSQETLSEYLADATEYGISVGKVKLIMRALDLNPELTFDEVKDYSMTDIIALVRQNQIKLKNTVSAIKTQLRADIQTLKTSEKYTAMFTLIYEIDDIEEQLENDDTLTTEQTETLQATLTQKQEEFQTTYATLFEEFKADRDELIAQAKADSLSQLVTIREQYRTRVRNFKGEMTSLRQRISATLRSRITAWQNAD